MPNMTRGWHVVHWLLWVTAVATPLALVCYLFLDQLCLLALNLWVERFPHATIEIVAFDAQGRQLDSVEFFRTWRPALIIRDLSGSPRFGLQYGLGVPKVAVPRAETVRLEMLWPVPGFGKVVVTADNQGRGYQPGAQEGLRIELLPEFARSQLAQFDRWVVGHSQGRCASSQANSEISSAQKLAAEVGRSADSRQRAMLSLRALGISLLAGEQEVLAEARRSIEQHRRGTLMVRVQDVRGRPLSHARVQLSETRPAFQFGVFSDGYDADTIARLKSLGLNYAELFMTWNRTQPSPGIFSLDQFDSVFNPAALADNDFTLCGHALVWLARGELPAYMNAMRGNREALVAEVREHVAHVVKHYKDRVQIWEAINEGHTAWARWGLDDDAIDEVAKAASEEIRKNAPSAQIRIELTLPLGEDVSLKHYPFMPLVSLGRIGAASSDPYEFAARLVRRGVPYDILALQFYNGAWVDVAGGVQVPAIDLLRFAAELERYATLGKPLQVAEIAVGSSHRRSALESWWHERATEQTQADYLEAVFTIAYAEPRVEGINWWGLYDEYRFVEDGGLFDLSRRPKPAAERLRSLLQSWHSEGEMTTGTDGSISFRGSSGDYRIAAQSGMTHAVTTGHISQGSTETVVLRMPLEQGTAPISSISHEFDGAAIRRRAAEVAFPLRTEER
jgi:endo-1,4-beta-xylanase